MNTAVQLLLIAIIGIGFGAVIPITFITCADVKEIIKEIRKEGKDEKSFYSDM